MNNLLRLFIYLLIFKNATPSFKTLKIFYQNKENDDNPPNNVLSRKCYC